MIFACLRDQYNAQKNTAEFWVRITLPEKKDSYFHKPKKIWVVIMYLWSHITSKHKGYLSELKRFILTALLFNYVFIYFVLKRRLHCIVYIIKVKGISQWIQEIYINRSRIQIFTYYKVQLFWEGQKNLRNLPYGFDVY